MGNIVEVPTIFGLIFNGTVMAFKSYDINNENLYDHFLENNGGVLKPRDGYDGFEVYIFKVKDNCLVYKNKKFTKQEFDNLVIGLDNFIIQKLIIQNDFENSLFSGTLNTIRIISVRKKDSNEHEIIGALQRIGTNRSLPVDNFAQGGGSAIIDVDTGKMSSMTCFDSFDDNGSRIFYDFHPDSHAQIKDTIIPNWENIKSEIIKITKLLPLFNYIAWDVALVPGGIAIIETNMKSSLYVFQVHGGMKNKLLGKKYKEYGYIK